MSPVVSKSNKIRHIVRIRQMLRQWRRNAAEASFRRVTAACIPSDVPAGHVAVSVGSRCTRFVVPASYLNHPIFEKLLDEAEEEYGFPSQGLVAIPCEESLFEQILQIISRSVSAAKYKSASLTSIEDIQRCCDVERQSESGACFEEFLINRCARQASNVWIYVQVR